MMKIKEATERWNSRYPSARVSEQTIRNWCCKFQFGEKASFLLRSEWVVNEEKFQEFVVNPSKYFCIKRDKE